jgi:hypothetical protein
MEGLLQLVGYIKAVPPTQPVVDTGHVALVIHQTPL